MQKFLTKIPFGLRKVHSTQHTLFELLQAWQGELDKSENSGVTLMELSKSYDCIPHNSLIAKVVAYSWDQIILNMKSDDLNNRKKEIGIASSFSSWYDNITGILRINFRSFTFNVFINYYQMGNP